MYTKLKKFGEGTGPVEKVRAEIVLWFAFFQGLFVFGPSFKLKFYIF